MDASPAGPIDLHAHTSVSDGTLPPAALVRLAARQGLRALAVTDHDHVGALAEAKAEGDRLGVEIVTGVELSVVHPGGNRLVEVHLLGYLFDENDPRLLARLQALRDARERRGEAIVARLRDLGVPVRLDDVLRHAAGGALGRPHVARALMDVGAATSIQDAFDRFLGEGRPAHVPKVALHTTEGMRLVHEAGGVTVVAHPVTLPARDQEPLLRALAKEGLDGLEVLHSRHAPEDVARFAALARELDLVATGGSDFHGDNKPEVALGSGTRGNVRVGSDVLDALKRRAETRRRG